MLKCSTPYPKVIHSLSTQFTDLSTAYTQLVHTLFYPISISLTAGSLHIYTQQSLHSLLTILPLLRILYSYSEQSSILYVLSLIHCIYCITQLHNYTLLIHIYDQTRALSSLYRSRTISIS
jgi:hypothetical protein